MGKVGHKWNNQSRVDKLKDIRRHHSLSHSRGSQWSNSIHSDITLFSFFSKGLSKPMQSKLSGRVVDLTKASEEARTRRGVDDPSVSLFAHEVPGRACGFVGAVDVDLENEVPIVVLHFLEGNVAKDPRVVQQNVDLSEGVDGRFDDFVSELNGVVVGHGDSALRLDFLDHFVGGAAADSLSRVGASEVVDNDFGASACKKEGVLFADSVSCPRHHDHLTVKSQCHEQLLQNDVIQIEQLGLTIGLLRNHQIISLVFLLLICKQIIPCIILGKLASQSTHK